MQFPGAVIGGPTMHPATMWLSKQAGAAGPEESRTQAGSQGARVSGRQGCLPGKSSARTQALGWTGVGGRSRLVDPEGAGVERWDGKSGHGAESVRHAEMSLAATGDRSGLAGLSVPWSRCAQ